MSKKKSHSQVQSSPQDSHSDNHGVSFSLVLGALGVVFGDIGTSPLYAFRECFGMHSYIPLTESAIIGVLSLVTWSLIGIISIKYLGFVMKAHNKGEGGVLALTALIGRKLKKSKKNKFLLQTVPVTLGILGAALLYADGIITPAISVLGAIEGLEIITPVFSSFLIPLAVIILCGLFYVQSRGTGTIGIIFGPLVTIWFVVIGLLGLFKIIESPFVLKGLNPIYAIHLFNDYGFSAFASLGSLFLVVTGAEALYADMGHFGIKPIARGWFYVVFPSLLLNYFGQGALLIADPSAISNPFYLLAPKAFIVPLVVLATLTSAVASQAVISGAFSLTRQAIQLGYFPRMQIDFTSSTNEGQIYVPSINKWLAFGSILLVIVFKTSSNLAAAYGIAVSSTMLLTSMLMFILTLKVWKWKWYYAFITFLILSVSDLAFLGANSLKLTEGGYVPVVIAIAIFTLMTTWYSGRILLGQRLVEKGISWEKFMVMLEKANVTRVPGVSVFMTRSSSMTPIPLVHNVEHNRVLHETVILLTIETEGVPTIPRGERVEVVDLGNRIFRIIASIGFQDEPDIGQILEECSLHNLTLNSKTTFFLGREILIPSSRPGMVIWREKLFSFMSRNAERATAFYKVPSEQVFEVGIQVEL